MRTHLIRVTAQELKQLLDKLVEPTHNVFALAAVNKGSVHPLLTFLKIVPGPSVTSGNSLCSQMIMSIHAVSWSSQSIGCAPRSTWASRTTYFIPQMRTVIGVCRFCRGLKSAVLSVFAVHLRNIDIVSASHMTL